MMRDITTEEKYAQPEVVDFWRRLSQEGLQHCEWEMVRHYFPSSGDLLDVGCGAGRALLALKQMGYQVTGIDLSLSMLAAGRSLSPAAPLGGANLVALPFADGSFEAVFMFFGALQHIPGRDKRRQALAEMARVARPRGRLILGLDNVAPTLGCYVYWLLQKLSGPNGDRLKTHASPQASTGADSTLWSRQSRRVHPLAWHGRGLLRTLRWRSWPGLVDTARRLNPLANGSEPGDIRVAQFALPPTPGRIYYHLYRAEELIEDALNAGWRLSGYHSGSELNEGRLYPEFMRGRDKQLFFAFEKDP
jgi:SAM-dependent methyltransferase